MSYRVKLDELLGERFAAALIAGMVGPGDYKSLLAWVDVSQSTGCDLTSMQHAVGLEEEYLAAVCDFADTAPPLYDCTPAPSREHLCEALGIDRLLCFVAQTQGGAVVVLRAYDGLEMNELDAVNSQIKRLSAALDDHVGRARPRRVN